MPEYPDITIYVEGLGKRVLGQVLERIQILDMFVLRTAVPPVNSLEGRKVERLRRVGKRIAIGFEGGRWLVMHLMIAGRLQWADAGAKPTARNALAHLVFARGALTLTEAGSTRRAALHVVEDEAGLRAHDPGGLEVMEASAEEFAAALTRENHTLKRALTDPRTFSGIGNAYSDEILHAAKLSPVALTQKLGKAEIERLWRAVREVLTRWAERLRKELNGKFPEKVTAFHPQMAVHGKFGKPCPVCGVTVERIRYAENEVNYCPKCQTGGKVLADRSLSRLLKGDWPRTVEEMETARRET